MRIVVFGANGRVGQLVVGLLAGQGHRITAFVHGNNPFSNPQINAIQGDIYSNEDVADAINNQDVVISTLGSWGTDRKDVLSSAMKNIIPAMNYHGVKRIVSLTGQAAKISSDRLDILATVNRLALKFVANKILSDGELHLRLLQESNLDWTVIRSPIMNNKPHVNYSLENKIPYPWTQVSRESVAQAMVDQISDKKFIGSAPYIR